MAFIFYDTETTGTDTRFDQILQFAAIKTDENLEEIDRFEIRCRLLPHVIMSPGAMLVTGVSIEQATDPSLPTHYAMVRAIRAKMLEWAPAIFVGYNSLAFDEELLRQAQYQTLHNPYLTQREGNARADAMMLVKAVAQFEPECLVIPSKANGRPNFKLDQLAPANGFDHSNAHDAMADVEAVIHLCRIIADGASAEWSNFIRFWSFGYDTFRSNLAVRNINGWKSGEVGCFELDPAAQLICLSDHGCRGVTRCRGRQMQPRSQCSLKCRETIGPFRLFEPTYGRLAQLDCILLVKGNERAIVGAVMHRA